MNDKEILDELFYQLNQIQEAESLEHINKITIDDKHPLTFYSEVTDQHLKIYSLPQHLFTDLVFLSNDLVHFTSLLFLLRPLINKEVGTYHQNWYDARYLSYTRVLHSTVYDFWDRIGDLLYCFFKTGLRDDGVYIGRVLTNIPKSVKSSSYFEQLNKIYNEKVHPIVFERNEDTHTQTIPTSHFYDILLAKGDENSKQINLKLSIADLFKEQIELAYKGFELSLRLIIEKVPKT
ncbi:MAG: hypothetical protein IIA58_02560 [Candidatus Marinimicrobia bacterium]|nr:hypothetical protein [Candidatus Neomarinimicrobiota bacterium]